MRKYLWAGLVGLFYATAASAGDVMVSDAWARATAPGQSAAAVQMTVSSNKAAVLVGGASAAASSVEIHTMVMEGNMMKMRQITELPLPAGKPVSLAEGGYHVMLIGLKKPLKEGEKVPFEITVQFADGSKATVKSEALVKPLTMANNGSHEHQH